MRRFTDEEGTVWEVSEVTRYGIGARLPGDPPVEANIGLLLFTAADGREVRAEGAAGSHRTQSDDELRELLKEAIAHDRESQL
jgi:hypothetical protein